MAAQTTPTIPFHPIVLRWFESRIGDPTDIQTRAWQHISRGDHVLITAPTGSGKTLAAFLWALDRLIQRGGKIEETRILYVSPLKALNNDVKKNLLTPLAQIRRLFDQNHESFPGIRVATRSGDTPSHRRRQMIRRPPEILITTPESLHLMLSSHGGRSVLGRIETVILDEIHAVAGGKRGTLLMSAVDRLVLLCGEFQRIALSATVNPMDVVARFVGGFSIAGDPADPDFIPRHVSVLCSDRQRSTVLTVEAAEEGDDSADSDGIWKAVTRKIKRRIRQYRSILIFVNSRRLCEKLTFLINADGPVPIAYAHHGSLSKELRLEVERRLKQGELKAIVATSSLELGIDIGVLDHVMLVQSPPSAGAALQRIGRSGHGVHQASTATIVPTHGVDCVNAAVLARMVMERNIEPIRPVQCPVDVLAQVLVSMTGVSSWDRDLLFHSVRASYPFRTLDRRVYDLVLEMLAGRYESTRISFLKPKIAIDRLDNTVTARKGALLDLYTSGGVIPDRGYFGLRHKDSGVRIGELDEEFVWEAKRGQTFTLGTQNWRIHRITHNDVIVSAASPKTPAPPFWRAEGVDRDFHLSERIGAFLKMADDRLDDPGFTDMLSHEYFMEQRSVRFLTNFLRRQREKTACALPHRHHVVVEWLPWEKAGAGSFQVIWHTFWGGRVNRPFALALSAAWENRYGGVPSVFPTNDALYLLLSREVDTADMMSLVTPENAESLVRQRLEGSGVFGARFRECAARALLLPRRRFNHRMPLWLTRQNAQRLLDAVGRYDDFPILLEAWRSCLQDDFDMAALTRVLRELERGEITWSASHSRSPSPLALSGSWQWINHHMYADDRQTGVVKTELSRDLLEQVIANPQLRPAVDTRWVAEFEEKRHRNHPGYAPDTPLELLEWVKERLLISETEWEILLTRAVADSGGEKETLTEPIRKKLWHMVVTTQTGDSHSLVVASENAPAIARALYPGRKDIRWVQAKGEKEVSFLPEAPSFGKEDPFPTAMDLLDQWLRFYGPVTVDFIRQTLALDRSILSDLLSDLLETGVIVSGSLVRGSGEERICHLETFETLLRMARSRQMATIPPRPIEDLAPVLARFQGLTGTMDKSQGLADCLQPLLGLSLPAALWETEIFPARLAGYDPRWMDELMQTSGLMWVGRPGKRLIFCHEEDLDLFHDDPENTDGEANGGVEASEAPARLFPDHRGRYPLVALLGDPPLPSIEVRKRLWDGVWAGAVTNDTMAALREHLAKGALADKGERTHIPAAASLKIRSRRYRRKGATNTVFSSAGNWRLIASVKPPEGLMEKEELAKDRVRLLLDRYGILFRQRLAREEPVLQWPALFRSLRLMELSGEVVSGCFFTDIPGPQFASRKMLRLIKETLPETAVFWLCAQDPASVCGLGIKALKGGVPRRLAGSHLVYAGRRLALVSEAKGKRVTIHLPVDHERLADCLQVFDHLLIRRVDPLPSITVETINGIDAPESPYLPVLRERFDIVVETGNITMYCSV